MLNVEYWKNELIAISGGEIHIALKDGVPCKCRDIECSECGFWIGTCHKSAIEWLCKEHKGYVTDWNSDIVWEKVPLGTEVLVSLNGTEWVRRCFVIYDYDAEEKYAAYKGTKDQIDDIEIERWRACRLVNPGDIEKYRRKG